MVTLTPTHLLFHKGILQQKIEPREAFLSQRILIQKILVVEELKIFQKETLVKLTLPMLHLRGKEK